MNARIILLIVAVLVIGGGTYFWWQGSPVRSFHEAGTAIKTHNITLFQEYVDEKTLLNGALDDAIFAPLVEAPWLNELQRGAGKSASNVARVPLEEALQRQLDKYVSGPSGSTTTTTTTATASTTSPATLTISSDASAPADIADTDVQPDYSDAPNTGEGTLKAVLQEAKGALRTEGSRLKNLAYTNMQNYALQHPDQLVCQLAVSDRTSRKSIIKQRLQEYGLVSSNFRGIAFVRDLPVDNDAPHQCIIGFKFLSPKLNREILAEVQLVQQQAFGSWRIMRFNNLRPLLDQLEPTYTQDLQGLALATVSGINTETAKDEIVNTANRILQAPQTKGFFNSLKNSLKNKVHNFLQ